MSKADRRARKRENKQLGRAEREAAVKRAKQRSGLIRGTIAVLAIVGGIAPSAINWSSLLFICVHALMESPRPWRR